MKINNPINSYIDKSYQSIKLFNNHSCTSNESVEKTIDISISDTGQSIFKGSDVKVSMDECRVNKLMEVKEAIKNGTYKVSLEQLSESLYREIETQKDVDYE